MSLLSNLGSTVQSATSEVTGRVGAGAEAASEYAQAAGHQARAMQAAGVVTSSDTGVGMAQRQGAARTAATEGFQAVRMGAEAKFDESKARGTLPSF